MPDETQGDRMHPAEALEHLGYLTRIWDMSFAAIARKLGCTSASVSGWIRGRPVGKNNAVRLRDLVARARAAHNHIDNNPPCGTPFFRPEQADRGNLP